MLPEGLGLFFTCCHETSTPLSIFEIEYNRLWSTRLFVEKIHDGKESCGTGPIRNIAKLLIKQLRIYRLSCNVLGVKKKFAAGADRQSTTSNKDGEMKYK